MAIGAGRGYVTRDQPGVGCRSREWQAMHSTACVLTIRWLDGLAVQKILEVGAKDFFEVGGAVILELS